MEEVCNSKRADLAMYESKNKKRQDRNRVQVVFKLILHFKRKSIKTGGASRFG